MEGWNNCFLGAVIGALVGSFATTLGQRWLERKKEQEKIVFSIYWLLMEYLRSHDTLRFLRQKPPNMIMDFTSKRKAIEDELRKVPNFPHLEEIYRAIYSLDFVNEDDRGKELVRLMDLLGENINPQFVRACKCIKVDNDKLAQSNPMLFFQRQQNLENP